MFYKCDCGIELFYVILNDDSGDVESFVCPGCNEEKALKYEDSDVELTLDEKKERKFEIVKGGHPINQDL